MRVRKCKCINCGNEVPNWIYVYICHRIKTVHQCKGYDLSLLINDSKDYCFTEIALTQGLVDGLVGVGIGICFSLFDGQDILRDVVIGYGVLCDIIIL